MDGDNVLVAALAMQDEIRPTTFARMRAEKRWLAWAPDKQPFYIDGTPRCGALDTPDEVARLSTFDDACRVVKDSGGRFVGIGFALGPDGNGGNWQGIDLDKMPDEMRDQWAAALPGYVELSPSGTGLHAIGYGAPFPALGSNQTGIEAYASGRYFTFTGRAISDAALTDLAPFVHGILAPLHGAQRPTASAAGTVYADPKTVTELRLALNAIPPDDYHQWIKVGRCLFELGPTGRELWLSWSQQSAKWKPEDARKWTSFAGSGAPFQTVFQLAQEHGWVNPASNSAQLSGSVAIASPPLEDLIFDWDHIAPLPPDLIAGLVADEEVTLLGGHGGIGKGFLALQLAVGVAVGTDVLGHPCTGPHRVLYYSAEDGRKRIGLRMRGLLESYSDGQHALAKQNLRIVDASELDPLYGITGKAGLGTLLPYAQLQRLAETFDPQLIVIDGASDTFDGNEIVKREVRSFIKSLLRLHPKRRIAVLLIVHIDRASARGHTSNDEGYSGNVAWHNSCRRRLYLQRKVERDEDKEEIGETILLRVMKNQDGPPTPDLAPVRQPNGFWQTAVSFIGGLERGGDYAPVILRLIGEYYARGKWISTSLAPQATTGVYLTLKGDPHCPPIGAKKTAEIVRQLEREKKIVPEEYRRDNGGKGMRWKLT